MLEEEIIVVRNAAKHYKTDIKVFNDLNMTVSKGTIYGLLGPSGCGKTTLLSCIVGLLHLNKGKIRVLGGSPGTKESGIPGPRVGYMPQETSLTEEFSTKSAFYYFGRINGLESDEIEIRLRFLSDLLQLPSKDHLVRNMSGGQQRRVSLAVALLHKPELLILDEPTVGLDPILRGNIWDYLMNITQHEEVTAVIVTHYIEEAQDANKIGVMRSGKLLTESSPQQLLEEFQCINLEEVFLTLSRMQEDNTAVTNLSFLEASGSKNVGDKVSCEDKNELKKHGAIECKGNPNLKVSRIKIFKALLVKNSFQFLFYRAGLLLGLLFPILQVCSFFLGIDMKSRKFSMGIINDEAGNCDHGKITENITYDEVNFTCHFENLSCRFLQDFGDFMKQRHYDSISEATTAIGNGELVGMIYFNQNFSDALQKRIEEFMNTKETDILTSEIQVSLDMGDREIGLYMWKRLYDHFLEIYANIMTDCNISPKFASIPILFEPIYGTKEMGFLEFMAPAYMLILIFFLANAISTSILITDRKEGVWKRSLVQGVTTTEIVLSHILIQVFIIIVQVIIILCLCFYIWGLECKGSLFVITCLLLLSGIAGLMYGFLLSVVSTNHTMAHYASMGSFFPLLNLSGCVWPVEAMPKVLRWIGLASPLTIPSMSVRAVMMKAYSIQEPEVYNGFLIIFSWILFFLIICLVTMRLKPI